MSPALVLGYPWLRTHNPHIDWAKGRIIEWDQHCLANYLCSAIPSTSVSPNPVVCSDASVYLTGVPATSHNLRWVFSKERALSLPPHRPYDCPIDLLPGAPLPSSRLYNLSRPEREAMELYITDSVAAGIIRHSSHL